MNRKLFLVSLILLLAVPLLAAPRLGSRGPKPVVTTLDNSSFIDANNLFMFVTNQGSFGRDLAGVFGYDYGTFFPYNGIQYILDGSQVASPLYASGLWIGGVDSATGETRVKVAEYNAEYWQGPWETAPVFVDNANIHVYHIHADSLASNPNADYTNWIEAARQGAPFVGDSATPDMIGDQMCWAVYHDRDDTLKFNDAGHTGPIGIEIRQTTFAFKREGPLNNIIFVKFQAYNRGGNTIQNCYFSLWADPDLGGSGDDLVGCDSTLGLGFIYNANNADADYGAQPPSLGYDFFQGPLVYTGELTDEGKAWGTTWPGYKNLGMVSFNKYINGTDPNDAGESYNYMQGFNADGSEYTYNGFPTKYFVAGDPVAGTGDLDFSPADRRFMQSTGPITFRPGDSVEILAAIIVGDGTDRKSSISVMKYYDVFAQKAYDDDFVVAKSPIAPIVDVVGLNGMVSLAWTDTSEIDHGDYPFEGYTIYQGASPAGPWTVIDNFAVLNATVKDEVIDPFSGQTETRVVKVAMDKPIQRYLGISEDFINGGPIFNSTRYYYKVAAYAYDPDKLPKILESSTSFSVIPQASTGDEKFDFLFGDTLPVTHTAGIADALVAPIVFDPNRLDGHTYRVTFRDLGGAVMVWNLYDVTAADTVLKDQTNLLGDELYQNLDGFRLKVAGLPGFKNFECVANASGVLDPPEGAAADFQHFPSLQPTLAQQVGGARWLIHTADNGTRAAFEAFVSRTTRDGGNWETIGTYDYEMRFTADGGYAFRTFGAGSDSAIQVPFELWNIGINTPDDPSDDFRMLPWMLDNDEDGTFNISSADHTVSGAGNDPYTDWIYWYVPADQTPGESGYNTFVTEILAGTYAGEEDEAMARMVLVEWNGGAAPPYVMDMPETGTVFRIQTNKTPKEEDIYTFEAIMPAPVSGEAALSQINTVPNPYYLIGPYDPAPTNRNIYFQHLPATCQITIYNLAGDLVKTINKTDTTQSIITWDVMTENNLPVASGIYIWVVDAPGLGQKIGKMAVFMEAEVIKKY